MAFSSYSTTPANNTTIAGLSIGEGTTNPSSVNDAIRQLMADGKTLDDTVVALTATVATKAPIGGTYALPVPAGAMIARTTNGAAINVTETSTNKIMVKSADFDQTTNEYVQFTIAMPKSWNEGTVTAQFIWTANATGDVVFGIQAVAISDDDVLDAAFGTAKEVIDSVTAAGDVMQSASTTAVSIAGSPAENDLVVFQVYRNAASASDTLAADAKLIAVRLKITTDAADDS